MDYNERKKFRREVLQDLYDTYFQNNGSGKEYALGEVEPEKILVYAYLEQKELIYKKTNGGSNFSYIISARGIDYIESNGEILNQDIITLTKSLNDVAKGLNGVSNIFNSAKFNTFSTNIENLTLALKNYNNR